MLDKDTGINSETNRSAIILKMDLGEVALTTHADDKYKYRQPNLPFQNKKIYIRLESLVPLPDTASCKVGNQKLPKKCNYHYIHLESTMEL